MDGASKARAKPASHEFRVGTDAIRQGYREKRAAATADILAARTKAAMQIAPHAAVRVERDRGYLVCPPGALDVRPVIAGALDTVDHVDIERVKAHANKPFMTKLGDMKSMTLESPFVQFALRHDVAAAAAVYLGLVPIIQFANVYHSSYAGDELAKSQLYHCDSDEVTQMKVFVFCEDVTADSGPLTVIPAGLSQQVRDRTRYRYKKRLSDDEVRGALGDEFLEEAITGQAGTVVFVDTSRCLHYGSRISSPTMRRLVVMLQYVTPLAFILPEDDFRAGASFRHLWRDDHDELTTLLLGAG